MKHQRIEAPALAMLTAIAAKGMARAEILLLGTHENEHRASSCLDTLSAARFIESIVHAKNQRIWVTTRKGRVLLLNYSALTQAEKLADSPTVPAVAGPRQVIYSGTYEPAPHAYLRQGSDKAFKLPSRIGSRLIERARA